MRDTTVGKRGNHSPVGACCQEMCGRGRRSGICERFHSTGRGLRRHGLAPRRQRHQLGQIHQMRDIVLQCHRPRMASVSLPSLVLIRVGWHSPRSRAHRYQGGEAEDAMEVGGLPRCRQAHRRQEGGEASRQPETAAL